MAAGDFDDPVAWGFCEYCAFEVAVDQETGKIQPHDRRIGGWEFTRCHGSLMDPTPQSGPEAKPKTWQEAFVEALEDDDS